MAEAFPAGVAPVRGFPPEENIKKDHHLLPTRLRRSSPSHRASSSGQHSFPGVELAVAAPSDDEHHAHRSWRFPPGWGFLPKEKITKDDHLRPRRLRRSSVFGKKAHLRPAFDSRR